MPRSSVSKEGTFALVLYSKVGMPDAGHAYNPWLQELAEPALRRGLRDKPPLERCRRIDRLLEKVAEERDNPSPERLRMLRALESLEYMDTSAARQALEQFAKGAAAADLTNEAKAALKRLDKLSSPQRRQGE